MYYIHCPKKCFCKMWLGTPSDILTKDIRTKIISEFGIGRLKYMIRDIQDDFISQATIYHNHRISLGHPLTQLMIMNEGVNLTRMNYNPDTGTSSIEHILYASGYKDFLKLLKNKRFVLQ